MGAAAIGSAAVLPVGDVVYVDSAGAATAPAESTGWALPERCWDSMAAMRAAPWSGARRKNSTSIPSSSHRQVNGSVWACHIQLISYGFALRCTDSRRLRRIRQTTKPTSATAVTVSAAPRPTFFSIAANELPAR